MPATINALRIHYHRKYGPEFLSLSKAWSSLHRSNKRHHMLGSITGDIIGSVFEKRNLKETLNNSFENDGKGRLRSVFS